ncbi:MAG: MATE family efflux transporter [Crocinitomicaceae bacterium]|nr:MATE family efflux transporter [Crocinitomicaceae bacterium]
MLEPTVKNILKVALPLMFGTFVQSIVAFTDAAFVSHLGTISFDAVGNASLIYMALYMLCRGFGDGTQIQIAKEYGKSNFHKMRGFFYNAFSIQILLSLILIIALISIIPSVIEGITESELIAKDMITYLRFRGLGFLFATSELILVAFLMAVGKTRIILVSTLILASTNIFLDYALIFGEFGFPELGLEGAAIASSCAELLSFGFLLIYILKSEEFSEFKLKLRARIDKLQFKVLSNISLPLMFQGFISISTWLVFFTFIEQMGPKELEASQCIRHLYFLAFIPIFGYASATKTFVSNLMGQNRVNEVPRVIIKLIILSVASLVLIFHGSILYPDTLVSLVNSNEEIYILASEILVLVSGSMLIFAFTTIVFNAVSGLGKTRISFLIELTTILIYVISSIVIFKYLQWEVKYTWIVEYIYFVVNGIISVLYLRHFFKARAK